MKTKIEFESKNKSGTAIKAFVKRPTQKLENDANLLYKAKFSEALRLGAITASEADRVITERGIFTAADQDELMKKYMELAELGNKLENIDDMRKGAQVIFEMDHLRREILTINIRRSHILDNTAESYADEHRMQFYVMSCTFKHDGSRMWNSIDEFLEDSDSELAQDAMRYMIYIIANKGEDFRSEWPEFKWKKKHGLIDDKLDPVANVDAIIEAVFKDEQEKTATIEQENKPKRKSRKKTTSQKE